MVTFGFALVLLLTRYFKLRMLCTNLIEVRFNVLGCVNQHLPAFDPDGSHKSLIPQNQSPKVPLPYKIKISVSKRQYNILIIFFHY